MMIKKACIFDFDGVIMDTEKYHFASWNSALSSFGFALTAEEYEPLKSTGRQKTLNFIQQKYGVLLSSEEQEGIICKKANDFKAFFSDLSEEDFILGAVDFVKKLHRQGIALAVASSGSETANLLRRFQLFSYFNCVLDGTTSYPKKPDPSIFLAALSALGVKRKDCVVFEDSLAGISAAKNADIDCVYVGKAQFPEIQVQIENFVDVELEKL